MCRDVVRGAEDCWYEDIDLDLLKLVRRFTEIGDNPPIDEIMTGIQCLKSCAFSGYAWLELEAAYCLKNILAKGKKEHKQMMVDSGVIASFKHHLRHSSDDVATVSMLALYEFIKGGPVGHVLLVVNDDGISRLIQVLDSKQEVCVEASLAVLVAFAKRCSKQVLDAILGSATICKHLLRLLKTDDTDLGILSNCLFLLYKLMEIGSPPIQHVLPVVPKLLEIMKVHHQKNIQTNLSHIVINLAGGTVEQTSALLQEARFLPILVSLIDSPVHSIAEKAMSAIEKIAKGDPKHCKVIQQSGVCNSLTRILTQPVHWMTLLRAASGTYAFCCSANADFVEFDNGVDVLIHFLDIQSGPNGFINGPNGFILGYDEDLVYNAFLALYHLLKRQKYDRVRRATETFAKPLAQQLMFTSGSLKVKEVALKILCIFTAAGLVNCGNVITYLKEFLYFEHAGIQQHACRAINGMISGSTHMLQYAIDEEVIPSLVQVMYSTRNRRHALWGVYHATKCGTSAQIIHLVRNDIIHHLCEFLLEDSNMAMMSLWSLKKVSV